MAINGLKYDVGLRYYYVYQLFIQETIRYYDIRNLLRTYAHLYLLSEVFARIFPFELLFFFIFAEFSRLIGVTHFRSGADTRKKKQYFYFVCGITASAMKFELTSA